MSKSIYGFDIPHDKGTPCRDIIAIQLPFPPNKVGSIHMPDIFRDFASHGTQAGIIRQMGPLAFQYKDGNGLARQDANVGDWVLIKWGAGTMFQAGKGIVTNGGWRYLSSFNDVIKVIPAGDMPEPDTLTWVEGDDDNVSAGAGLKEPVIAALADNKLSDADLASRRAAVHGDLAFRTGG